MQSTEMPSPSHAITTVYHPYSIQENVVWLSIPVALPPNYRSILGIIILIDMLYLEHEVYTFDIMIRSLCEAYMFVLIQQLFEFSLDYIYKQTFPVKMRNANSAKVHWHLTMKYDMKYDACLLP